MAGALSEKRETKEIRIEVRVKNNRLYSLIMDGFESIAEFCRTYELHIGPVHDLIRLKVKPVNRQGILTKSAKRLSLILNCSPEYLFPEHLYKIKSPLMSRELSIEQAWELAYTGSKPKSDIDTGLVGGEIRKALEDLLRPREKELIFLRFGLESGSPATLNHCSEKMGISSRRARQIEEKAILRLRRPNAIAKLSQIDLGIEKKFGEIGA